MRVVWTRTALRGIARAYDYLFEFSSRTAMHMAEALRAAGDSLERFPHQGSLVRGTGMRELVSVSPYVVR